MTDRIKYVPGLGFALRLNDGMWTLQNGVEYADVDTFAGVQPVAAIMIPREDSEWPRRERDVELFEEIDEEVFRNRLPNQFEQTEGIPEEIVREINIATLREFIRRQPDVQAD